MEQGITYRVIDGVRCKCKDLGCADFIRAKRNRLIVSEELFTTFYKQLEYWLAHSPRSSRMPSWISLGSLPQVGSRDWKDHGGEQGGMYELED
uniref:Uncharacterized protein n=1 Tax=viral metagenome TaxID=1070528 RepID=A0A6H2A527_9ZZZZ